MGIKSRVSRSTLADANESRDWRIYADFAQSLIAIARRLYATEPFGVDLNDTVYALDASTIDLCLSVLPLGAVSLDQGRHQAAHAVGPARQHPFVPAHQRRQTARRQRFGSLAARARCFLHHGPRLHRLRPALPIARSEMLLCHSGPSPTSKPSAVIPHPVDRSTGLICDQTIVLTGFYSKQDFDTPLRRVRFKDPTTGKGLVFLTNHFTLPALTITELYRCRWQIELFFKWVKQPLRIKVFYGTTENAVKTQIWIAVSVYVLVAIVEKTTQPLAQLV